MPGVFAIIEPIGFRGLVICFQDEGTQVPKWAQRLSTFGVLVYIGMPFAMAIYFTERTPMLSERESVAYVR